MKRVAITAFFVLQAGAAHAQADGAYAEDVLRAEAAETIVANTGCAQVLFGGQQVLTTNEAQAVLCMAIQQLPLALSVMEFGAAERAEILLGAMAQTGIPASAMGRIYALYGNTDVSLQDPRHGDGFYEAWQLVFGTDFERRILLQKADEEQELDVDGQVTWHTGHVAATVWVRDNPNEMPQLRVLDPLLSPARVLTPEEWRSLQHAESASLAWGAVGEVPVLMVEYLPENAVTQLKRQMNIASTDPVDSNGLNQLLRASSPEIRTETMAKILNAPDKAPWHPRHWAAYSLTGELKEPSGLDVPDWREGRDDISQRRIETAVEHLQLFQAYHDMRSDYETDEAFLQEVKRRMLANNKKPKKVLINFDE